MNYVSFRQFGPLPLATALVLAALACQPQVQANPTGGTVSQGSASISGIGSSAVTINQTSANAFINWSSFDIGVGETTTFKQPSSSSVTWNYIGDTSASSIDGNLYANGYVILQNPNGFTVGGSAVINTHGLVMTTASTPNLDLSGGGTWSFDAPPPAAKIINYGQINITGGGSAYLIANDIENNGTISAPNGKIGLYAGEKVLVSTSPDGRGLSAQVTLPQGSVDNEGHLIADAGNIVANAQVVNQNGVVQANSVQNVNGTIELVASSSLNLGATSQINAHGDSTASSASPGGFVVLNAGKNTFTDQSGSSISVSGVNGGQSGIIEIMGTGVTANSLKSNYGNPYALLINSYDMTLSSGATSTGSNPTLNLGALSQYSQIDLQALDNITLNSGWTLADEGNASTVNLTAGNNINLNSSITAGNNWNLNLIAGAALSGVTPTSGNDGIYLSGNSYLQTLNGDINLDAANEVIVGGGAIRTIGGGNIDVTAEYGNVNSGTSTAGYNYFAAGNGSATAPYYTPFQISGFGLFQYINFSQTLLGGISTAAGGNVTINAGKDVISFPTTTVAAGDPGTGAFGPEAGNVIINAGGSVYGHFVEANGTATINAGQNIGTANNNVALSLVNGDWNLNAQDNIYLQEVRNPNGVFNNTTVPGKTTPSAGNHYFDYSPSASVSLSAGNGVYLTGYNLPRPNGAAPMLLPPTLDINAGAGGVNLQLPNAISGNGNNNAVDLAFSDYTLFPSALGNLQITTTDGGNLVGGTGVKLRMSDSGQTQWSSSGSSFGPNDHASIPVELGNENPVVLNIAGNMENLILQVNKLADISVGGDMTGCSFYGENLNAGDITSINVGGQIYNAGSFTTVTLNQALPDLLQLSQSLSMASGNTYLPPGSVDVWNTILAQAIDPSKLPTQSLLGATAAELNKDVYNALAFHSVYFGNITYNPLTKTLTAIGPLSGDVLSALEQPTLTLVVYGPNGAPLVDNNPNDPNYGHIVTATVPWFSSANASSLSYLNTASQNTIPLGSDSGAYVVGGTGYFDVNAASIDLGNSLGILSVGDAGTASRVFLGQNYSTLAPYITSGATINVTANYLQMTSSTIAALGGGDVNIKCNGEIPNSTLNSSGIGVSMDLGSPDLASFEAQIMALTGIGLGVYTSGGGNVNLTADGTINIDSSRVATFDGGNINILSERGDVNAGSGGTIAIPVISFPVGLNLPIPYEYAYANGIVADTLQPQADGSLVPGTATLPGNITVITPQGSIYASLGGILQETLSGDLLPGPTITLEAGTPAGGDWNSTTPATYVGNIELGNSGVIGGTVNIKATGKVSGLLISAQTANVAAQTLGNFTLLAGGTANVSSQGSSGGVTIVGGQGVNATGLGSGALVLGQNVSVNGATAQSTLGSSASSTAASSSAAGQMSSEAQQQVASNDNGDDEDKKKKKKPQIHKVSRVTVILSSAVPPQ